MSPPLAVRRTEGSGPLFYFFLGKGCGEMRVKDEAWLKVVEVVEVVEVVVEVVNSPFKLCSE